MLNVLVAKLSLELVSTRTRVTTTTNGLVARGGGGRIRLGMATQNVRENFCKRPICEKFVLASKFGAIRYHHGSPDVSDQGDSQC